MIFMVWYVHFKSVLYPKWPYDLVDVRIWYGMNPTSQVRVHSIPTFIFDERVRAVPLCAGTVYHWAGVILFLEHLTSPNIGKDIHGW